MEPPELIVSTAVAYATYSPCAKSRRGVVIFDRGPSPGVIRGTGFNGPPRPFVCDGSDACRRDCGRICVHAEMRAVMSAQLPSDFARATGEPEKRSYSLELVHVAVDASGKLMAGCGPCCEQCSRLILDAGIAHVWLYEAKPSRCPGCKKFEDSSHRLKDRRTSCPDCDAVLVTDADWYAYTAAEFHLETLRSLKLHVGIRRDVHPFVRQLRSPRYCAACGQEDAVPDHRV